MSDLELLLCVRTKQKSGAARSYSSKHVFAVPMSCKSIVVDGNLEDFAHDVLIPHKPEDCKDIDFIECLLADRTCTPSAAKWLRRVTAQELKTIGVTL